MSPSRPGLIQKLLGGNASADRPYRFLLEHLDPSTPGVPFEEDVFESVFSKTSIDLSLYREMLRQRNGFFCYHRSLHFFGACRAPRYHSLLQWNDPEGWRKEYRSLAENLIFFAEDVFGYQFALRDKKIVRFDFESGVCKPMARSFRKWFQLLEKRIDEHSGWPVAVHWEEIQGQSIPFESHLSVYPPFIAGGEYDAEHLKPIDRFQHMGFSGHLAWQIKDLPDGTQIEISFEDENPTDSKTE